jgi:hypothetical protein
MEAFASCKGPFSRPVSDVWCRLWVLHSTVHLHHVFIISKSFPLSMSAETSTYTDDDHRSLRRPHNVFLRGPPGESVTIFSWPCFCLFSAFLCCGIPLSLYSFFDVVNTLPDLFATSRAYTIPCSFGCHTFIPPRFRERRWDMDAISSCQ